jgi:biopolymer transport protein ExbD
MAEILSSGKPGKRKPQSPKVDLTPMVDLGFLLISFFVFTTTLFQPNMLSLVLPDQNGPPTKIPESGAVTLIARAQEIYYYQGDTPPNKAEVKTFAYDQKDLLRQTLLGLKRRLVQANGDDEKLMVLIKPADDANMGMLVGLLDEMSICAIKRYSIAELNETERSW